MNHTFLALGSNIGDKKKFIKTATGLLSRKVNHIKQASLYESKAVGFTEQDNFVNTVISGRTNLRPEELLIFIKDIEKKVGRIERFRWGPREIDIDVLFYDSLILKTENLEIPHPRLHERDFVLVPLTDLSPKYIHPVRKKTVTELLHELPVQKKSIVGKLS